MGFIFAVLELCALISITWGKKTGQAWANGIYNVCLFFGLCLTGLVWYAAYNLDSSTKSHSSKYNRTGNSTTSAPAYDTSSQTSLAPASSPAIQAGYQSPFAQPDGALESFSPVGDWIGPYQWHRWHEVFHSDGTCYKVQEQTDYNWDLATPWLGLVSHWHRGMQDGRPAILESGSCYYIMGLNTLRDGVGAQAKVYHRTGL